MASPPQTTSTTCCAQQTFTELQSLLWAPSSNTTAPTKLPQTAIERLNTTSKDPDTILYLAYGSNLSAETFKGARGIKPLSALNVHVPSLTLTFDLAGIPYNEPCFANTRYTTPPSPTSPPTSSQYNKTDYHKNRWHKGLIGVVYEVTPADYRTIIATEGGGASYHDVVVQCFALPPGTKTINAIPTGAPFSAHTLLRPPPSSSTTPKTATGDGIIRPDPSYAQPSARYLNLITSGGEEHSLPSEYMAYLYSIRPYTITTARQRAGQAFIFAVWMPVFLLVMQLGKMFADEEGKVPGWLAGMMGLVLKGVWGSYDGALKRVFGDGERTVGDEGDEECGGERWREKSVRLE